MSRTPPRCPISGYRFAPFAAWAGVLHAVENRTSLFYWAPLDTAPRPVFVTKAFKNRKLRINGGEVTFTADPSHLERFYRIEKETHGQS